MPYKSEKITISGTTYDRRVKLSEAQRCEIRERYRAGGVSTYQLANEYGVSRRTIAFILDPDKYERCREQFKERRRDGRYDIPTEERTRIMREHRKYKHELFKNGLI